MLCLIILLPWPGTDPFSSLPTPPFLITLRFSLSSAAASKGMVNNVNTIKMGDSSSNTAGDVSLFMTQHHRAIV